MFDERGADVIATDAGRSPPRLRRGEAYTRDEIHASCGGSKRACLPMKNGVVVAACLLRSFNPDAPEVVLCGTGPRNGAMGAALAKQRTPLPMFVKQGVGRWIFEGWFSVSASVRSGPRFDACIARSSRVAASVSRVVILKRVR